MNCDVLVLGAGRSATALITYLLAEAADRNWLVAIADTDIELVRSKVKGHPQAVAVRLDVADRSEKEKWIRASKIVVSLLPPPLHPEIAKACLQFGKHLVTASYWTPALLDLQAEVTNKGLIFMGEMGLDPGIDHMSAKKKIDEIQQKGGRLTAFRSYTGGLIAPESDDNPWHYKVTWNPRNVVTAGTGTARFLSGGKIKYLPYHRLFQNYKLVDIAGWGTFEVYPNRDSLKYQNLYGLGDLRELYRGTIRNQGFCDAWHCLVQLGLTDTETLIDDVQHLTYAGWVAAFLDGDPKTPLATTVAQILDQPNHERIVDQLAWLGLFEHEQIALTKATSADILQTLLLEKWQLKPEDKDLILMQHEFEFEKQGRNLRTVATMGYKGKNAKETAMTTLVGLPLGIFVKKVLLGELRPVGVRIPIDREIYEPILDELSRHGVVFQETEMVDR